MSMEGRTIAVIGDGPRALWGLERLAAHLERPDTIRPANLVVFGAHTLGPGRVYDTSQPHFLRLNVPSASVDAWPFDDHHGLSFDLWREQRQPGLSGDQFPGRALVGAYLEEQGTLVLARLRNSLGDEAVEVRPTIVERIRPAEPGPGWILDSSDSFDEVLIAVGHEASWPGALVNDWGPHDPPLHPSVFPIADLVARPELKPGATVLIRGAALTAIDAVLALSVGRGFQPADNDLNIVLASRTARLMAPKTDPIVLKAYLETVGDLRVPAQKIATGEPVLEVLRDVAVRFLRDAPHVRRDLESVSPRSLAPGNPVAELKERIDMARGLCEPDAWWALGQAWRVLYPDLVARQSATPADVAPLGWPEYREWSTVLERLAFGPPLVNADLLLQGLSSGKVQVMSGSIRDMCPGADLVVDAVLPPPGIADLLPRSLLGRLRDDGVLTRSATGRGAQVGPDARVLDKDGRAVPGLALIGRATEDHLIGNDTLIRTLHPQVDAWARSVLR